MQRPVRRDVAVWDEIDVLVVKRNLQYLCVLMQRRIHLLDAGEDLLSDNDRSDMDFLYNWKPSQANLSDVRSLDGDSTQKEKKHGHT